MSQSREEKYPLLLLLLEDGKTHHEKEGRGVWSEKGRYQDIGNGAATVITQWPGHLTNCWIGALIAALIFILVFIMTMASTARPDTVILSMCKNKLDENGKHSNVTKVHLVHSSGRWHSKQLDVLKKIVESFPQNTVEVLLIQNRVSSLFSTNRRSTGQTTLASEGNNKANHTEEQEILSTMPTNAITIARSGWSDVLEVINNKYAILLKKITSSRKANETQRRIETIDNFESCYPNVNYTKTTYEDVFKLTPFHYSWQHLNYKTRDFAIRILYLWNYGGISFDLEQSESFISVLKQIIVFSSTHNRRVFSDNHVALLSSLSFAKLPEDVVIIDNEGRYMQTRAPCHVFFAEVLLKLKSANRHTEIKDILESTLRQFCKRGAVTKQYCDKLK